MQPKIYFLPNLEKLDIDKIQILIHLPVFSIPFLYIYSMLYIFLPWRYWWKYLFWFWTDIWPKSAQDGSVTTNGHLRVPVTLQPLNRSNLELSTWEWRWREPDVINSWCSKWYPINSDFIFESFDFLAPQLSCRNTLPLYWWCIRDFWMHFWCFWDAFRMFVYNFPT